MFRNEMHNRHRSCYSKHIRFFTEQRYIKYINNTKQINIFYVFYFV